MSRLTSLLLPLATTSALAQSAAAEAPVEHASGTTVVLFLVLFFGMCAAYGWYAWYSGRKEKREQSGKP
jgi:hypothetical protein